MATIRPVALQFSARARAQLLAIHEYIDQRNPAAAHSGGEERERMYRRALAQERGVETLDHQRDHEPDVAAIERDAEHHGEAAVTDDDKDAAE